MRISIILGHPKPGSFNHAIAATARDTLATAGHDVILHDLQAEGFDPVLPPDETVRDAKLPPDIQRHCDEALAADAFVIVHPNWWGQPPAILKGWFDRVMRMGLAYRFGPNAKGEIGPIGLLRARQAIVFTTANTPQAVDLARYGDPLQNLWTRCMLEFVGIPHVRRISFDPVIVSTPEQRAAWLADVRQHMTELAQSLSQPQTPAN